MAEVVSADDYSAQFETPLWKKWEVAPYPLIRPDCYPLAGYGADHEPHSSLWMAHLAEAMGTAFREGMTLLDYGCGAARFANFMSGRLQDFTYYGLEPRESRCGPGYGPNGVEVARELFGQDPRIHLGFIGEVVEAEAIETADTALLGSIFTHLRVEDSLAILAKLKPIAERGGTVVYTVILGEEYSTVGPGGHGLSDCFSIVTNTREQFEGYGKPVGKYRTMYGSIDQTLYRIGEL